jgi:hypothetical protein
MIDTHDFLTVNFVCPQYMSFLCIGRNVWCLHFRKGKRSALTHMQLSFACRPAQLIFLTFKVSLASFALNLSGKSITTTPFSLHTHFQDYFLV